MDTARNNFSYVERNNYAPSYGTESIDPLVDKDTERHLKFFNSLNRKSKKGSMLGVLVAILVMAAAAGTGILLSNRNVGTETTSAGTCSIYQIKVADANGFYCKPCGPGGYGDVVKCEDDSPTGMCTQDESGCYIPLL